VLRKEDGTLTDVLISAAHKFFMPAALGALGNIMSAVVLWSAKTGWTEFQKRRRAAIHKTVLATASPACAPPRPPQPSYLAGYGLYSYHLSPPSQQDLDFAWRQSKMPY
jgi:hypothetical protein